MCHATMTTPPFWDDLPSSGWDLLRSTCIPSLKFQLHPLRKYDRRCKMYKMRRFGAVRGHSDSRSSAMLPFDIAHTTSYLNYASISFSRYSEFFVESRRWTHLCLVPWYGVTPEKFRGDLWHQIFLPRDATLARYMPWPCVRPSVRHKSEFYRNG